MRKSKRTEEVEEEQRDIWEGLDPAIDLDVNEADLIGEMLNQSSLHFRYSRLVSVAEEEMNFAAEVVKTTRSQITLDVNRDPSILDGAKPTGPNVEAYYRTHSEYKAVKELYLTKHRIYSELMSVVYALGHKKTMLEHLARYELSGLIYSEPRLPADASDVEKEALREKQQDRETRAPKRRMRGRTKD